MSKPTVRDRAAARKAGREARRTRPGARAMDIGPAGPHTAIEQAAPGLTQGPIKVPGGMVKRVDERVPRLPCPSCGFVISLSLQDLITASGFTCPKCQLTLNMNREESEEALQHVQNFYVAMKDLQMK